MGIFLLVFICKYVHLFAILLSILLRIVIHDKLDLQEIDLEFR